MSLFKQQLQVPGLYNKNSVDVAHIQDTITPEQRLRAVQISSCDDTCRVACPVCQITKGKLCDRCMAQHNTQKS